MKLPNRSLVAAAALLVLAAAPAHAVLERVGPINKAPSVGGFPAWYQDKTGITLEFCDFVTAAERDAGWCTANTGAVPENFPTDFGPEHFYFAATNDMRDPGTGLRAKLILALEAGFSNEIVPLDGDQMVFGRQRISVPNLPIDGDYRVITPYGEFNFHDMRAGDKIAYTSDIGLACVATFECSLKTAIGPFLLPAAFAGGAEVPPMPDLKSAPPGTDPFYDALVALGGATIDPGTGKKYIADPGRVGPVTGSALPDFVAYEVNDTYGARNHNTFRIEVREPSIDHNGPVIYTLDGTNNFTLGGRLMMGTVPGKVTPTRGSYKADALGNVTVMDVFANASPTTQARMPAQPQQAPVLPVLSYYDQPCAGAVTVDADGMVVHPPPYGAPAGTPHVMAQQGTTFWAQSQPGGLPPTHVCIVDSSARDATGQTIPAYYLQRMTDTITVNAATFDGPSGGKLAVTAQSSDPTAVLTLVGYGPATAGTPGVATADGAGTGLDLAGGAASVTGLMASPPTLQVSSSKGGSTIRPVETALGMPTGAGTGGGDTGGGTPTTPVIGTPVAVNDATTMFEDCSATSTDMCQPGQSLQFDLIGNDTITVNGQVTLMRDFARMNLAPVIVTAQAPRLGTANLTSDGLLTYIPNPNASGTDSVPYTVTVNGKVSNQGILTINITPVNDLPFAALVSSGAVVNKTNTVNLLSTSSDPDGAADLKDAVIVTWPTQLGARPTPVNGVASFTPTTTGTYNVVFQVKDAAGALSPNTATASINVALSETISFVSTQFTVGQLRWVVKGTDTVRQGQTLTLVYADGKTRGTGITCNGTASLPECVIGTAQVDSAGNWLFDQIVDVATAKDPSSTTFWQRLPTTVKAISPSLGGTGQGAIVKK